MSGFFKPTIGKKFFREQSHAMSDPPATPKVVAGLAAASSLRHSADAQDSFALAQQAVRLAAGHDNITRAIAARELGLALDDPSRPLTLTGGLTFAADDPDTILIGGAANTLNADIHSIGVTRDVDGHIIGFHPEGIPEVLAGLLSRGSFGISWYAIFTAVIIASLLALKRDRRIQRTLFITALWGGIMFFEILFIYLFTPNVTFLLNAESFYRQMMLPCAMLILTLACTIHIRTSE